MTWLAETLEHLKRVYNKNLFVQEGVHNSSAGWVVRNVPCICITPGISRLVGFSGPRRLRRYRVSECPTARSLQSYSQLVEATFWAEGHWWELDSSPLPAFKSSGAFQFPMLRACCAAHKLYTRQQIRAFREDSKNGTAWTRGRIFLVIWHN
jgi:hypothetical protein